jgi:hypothetical protein
MLGHVKAHSAAAGDRVMTISTPLDVPRVGLRDRLVQRLSTKRAILVIGSASIALWVALIATIIQLLAEV